MAQAQPSTERTNPPSSLSPAIATVSLGRASAGHDILSKIRHAASSGLTGVEIFFECLEHLARNSNSLIDGVDLKTPVSASREELLEAASQVHRLCEDLNVTVLCLQPFAGFEGLVDEDERAQKFELLEFWFQLCHILKTDLIQIPSNFSSSATTGDLDVVVADLRRAAELGLRQSPAIRFAYEGLSWGTHIDTWEQTWHIAQQVDKPNFGLCLDVFHIAGRVWADPSLPSGLVPNGDESLDKSLDKLVQEVDVSKIFYVQIGDAERLKSPIVPGGHAYFRHDQKPRMSWSRNARLFPFGGPQRGGYLPVERVCRAIFVTLGWTGWTSLESFSREYYRTDERLVSELAERAKGSWARFVDFVEGEKEKSKSQNGT